MKVYAATKKSPVHFENEDRIIIGKTIINNGFFECEVDNALIAIADGVGGQNAGAVASHFVANEICQLKEITLDSLKEVNDRLIEKSKSDASLEKMATTLSALVISEKTSIFHVGNTRIYSLKNGKYLRQFTQDDTSLNFLLQTNRLSEEDAEHYENKNQITACFGSGDANLLRLKQTNITDSGSTVFVFTTDGIHDYVSLDELEDIFIESSNYADVCKNAIKKAEENNSSDDKSIIIGVL